MVRRSLSLRDFRFRKKTHMIIHLFAGSEAEILYTAVFSNEKTIHFVPEKLQDCRDIVGQFDQGKELSGIVHVYDVSAKACEVYNDVADEHLLITLA